MVVYCNNRVAYLLSAHYYVALKQQTINKYFLSPCIRPYKAYIGLGVFILLLGPIRKPVEIGDMDSKYYAQHPNKGQISRLAPKKVRK